ncbi:MAG TPA: GspH/FimT family pseudopilin [Longimicrobiaceae bacterium]|nr:GspH/FimT family pseudopilin [Longimicrobiaceae bacterium]
MPSRHFPAGYTLIELLSVIAILGITAALAVPSLTGTFATTRGQAALSRIAGDLYLARMQAVRRGERVSVRFDSTASGEFSGRYQIIATASGVPIKAVELELGPDELRMTNRPNALVFNSRGLLVGVSNRKIWIESEATADTLVVSRLGRVYRGW